MAVKAMLASLEGVPEALAAEYKKGDDGKFYLEIDGIEEHAALGALKRAKEHEKTARQEAETIARDARAKLETLTTEMEGRLKGVIPKADADRLELSYKEKMAARETELAGQIKTLSGSLHSVLVDNVAQVLASNLAKDALSIPLLLPHIAPRLAVEMVEGRAITRVLDREGKPSASSLDDLQKEILATPMFAPVLSGGKASGGGAEGAGSGSGAPKRNDKVNLATLKPAALAAEMAARAGE
jgi:hypothetical protein